MGNGKECRHRQRRIRAILYGLILVLIPCLCFGQSFRQINDHSFKAEFGKWRSVYIGDSTYNYFAPKVKIDRWGGECWMSLEYPTKLKRQPTVQGGKVIWSNPDKIEIQMFTLSEENYENGGFEYLIILKEKPASNQIVLNIESNGVQFLYQPALSQEEIDQGCKRPDSVLASYAVYHDTRGVMHEANTGDADKYKTGKIGHWYRPEAEDADGKKIWCDLNIANGKMSISVPDGLVYPVSVDPTFGYTSVGATEGAIGNYIEGSLFTGAAGTVDSLTAYIHFESGGPPKAYSKFALYKHSDSSLISGSDENKSDALEGWHSYVVSGSPEITAVDYVLVAWTDALTTTSMWYDTGVSNQSHLDPEAYNSWPNPAIWTTHNSKKYSIYCTYTSGAAEEVYSGKGIGRGIMRGVVR